MDPPSTTGRPASAAFTLVELLVVIAIIAIMMGAIGLGIQGMTSSSLQVAASQVSSGASLARQIAISKNTFAALIVATNTNGANMPSQPYKYWTVVSSNRGAGNWRMEKEWEPLPEGVIFCQFIGPGGGGTGTGYSAAQMRPLFSTASIGTPYTPVALDNQLPLTNSIQSPPVGSTIFQGFRFTPTGRTAGRNNQPGVASAIRLGQGAVDVNGNLVIRNTNNFYFVETDTVVGRIRTRSIESYNP